MLAAKRSRSKQRSYLLLSLLYLSILLCLIPSSQGFQVRPLKISDGESDRAAAVPFSLHHSFNDGSSEAKVKSLTPSAQRVSEAHYALTLAETYRSQPTKTSYEQAIAEYDKAAEIQQSMSDFSGAANAKLSSGDISFWISDYRGALGSYQSARQLAKRVGDVRREARALSQMGLVQSYLGNNDLAHTQTTQALNLLKNKNDEATNEYGEALSNLAEVSYARGDFLNASQQLNIAVELLANNRKALARVYLFRAYIAGSLGQTDLADTEISQALNLFRKASDKTGEALATTAVGLSLSRRGQDSQAIQLYLTALEIFRSTGDRYNEAIALNALAESNQSLGEYAIAISDYEKALHLFEEIGAMDMAAVSTFQLGLVYELSGSQDRALDSYRRCVQRSRTAHKSRTEINALKEIARIKASQGQLELALNQYQHILKFYEQIGDVRGQALVLNTYGDFLLNQQKPKSALIAYQRALSFGEKVGEQAIVISTLYNLARADLDLNSPAAALPFIQRSLKTIEDARTNVTTPDFRVSYFSGVQKHYGLCIEILMQLERIHPNEGHATEALLVSEKSRARSLLDLISESRATSKNGPLQERERELNSLFRIQAQFRMDLALTGQDLAQLDQVDKQLDQLRSEYQQLQIELKEQDPQRNSLEQTRAPDLSQIQTVLRGDNNMLLEYSLGDEHSYLWAVTPEKIQTFQLPPRKIIEDAAREFYEHITARQLQANDYRDQIEASDDLYRKSANKLGEMLLAPVADQLGTKRLLVVRDGGLQNIPFEALPVGPEKLLIESNEVVAEPSISALIASRQTQKDRNPPNKLVAIIADPVFSRNDDRVSTALAAGPNTSSLARLTHASEEADTIAAIAPWGTTMLATGFEANRETATSDLAQYQIVHFATHAFLDTDHPELSGIVLTSVDRAGRQTNGVMPLHEIYNLDLSAQLTVLSACQTALGRDIKGEGLVGLTHSFMAAGSKSVVASLWKIDDRATASLMADFYQSMLRQGMSPSAALRIAKLNLLHSKRWNAPYYWAGFVLQGEYSNHITVERHSSLRIALVLFSVLIAAGLFLLFKPSRPS
jgi:CHAT domain-containing protein/tetratricopeptide (TPR) repeat protein